MIPVSTYGASKLAGEALISAYAYMFEIQGVVTRFGNVVGRRQTHGVGFDFVRSLRADPSRLEVMGDGRQSKSYVLVTDVVAAVLTALDAAGAPFRRLQRRDRRLHHGPRDRGARDRGARPRPGRGRGRVRDGSPRGWKGDVPIVRLATERIRALGGSRAAAPRTRCGPRWRRCSPTSSRRRRLTRSAMRRQSSSIATACSTAPASSTGCPRAAESLADLEILDDAPAGCRGLREAGFLLICVTNQPEIARGGLGREDVDAINARLAELLGLDEVIVCPHDGPDDCECRKPKPGMTLDAARRHDIDLAASYTVGDRWRDVEAGRRAGTTTVFIDRGYNERLTVEPDAVFGGLGEASEWIVARSAPPH